MATAHFVSHLVYVAAQMNLAGCLAESPKTAEELARSTRTDAPSLYRLMRTLASLGLFAEDSGHRFSLRPLGDALKTGTPGSVRGAVLMLAGDMAMKCLGQLHYSVQTGKTGFEKVFGAPMFEWLASHPADASMFGETMDALHGAEAAAVATAYNFFQFETVVDVGAPPVICSPPFLAATADHAVSSLTCHALLATRRHCSRLAD
jgi:hypothetical protein